MEQGNPKKIFIERQRFTQWWVWVMLGALVVLAAYALVQQFIFGIPFGEHPMPNGVLIGFALLVFILAALMWIVRLDTRIDVVAIEFVYFPFFKKRIAWSEVDRAEMIQYGFVGYGIRVGTRHGTVYNTGGREGLALKLKDGRRYVVGTRNEKELGEFLHAVGLLRRIE